MYKKYPICLALVFLTNGAIQATEPSPEAPLDSRLSGCIAASDEHLKPINQALAVLYSGSQMSSIWTTESRQAALKETISQLTNDGLNPAKYQPKATSDDFCQDVARSQGYLQALYDLRYGAVDRQSIQPLWQSEPPSVAGRWREIGQIAKRALPVPEQAFEQVRPRSKHYLGLRQYYQQLSAQAADDAPLVPAGALLKPGMSDARVSLLAKRLTAKGYGPVAAEQYYDESLVSAVKAFQRDQGLQADGVLGPRSLAVLNQSSRDQLRQIRVNLERWRWLEHEQEPDQILVDIAASMLSYEKNGQLIWQGRTQVGRVKRQTPEIKAHLTQVTLNPTWTIPPTIMREDKLPQIRRDPGYLARNNMRVLDRNGNQVSPASVNWANPGSYMVRQQPGRGNPLGRMVLRFNNPYSIYLHDTPSQHLFNRSPRDFSSGCVRVEGIAALVQTLMSDAEAARAQKALASGRTHNLAITERTPILLAYWTAQIKNDGQLELRPDIYQLDEALAQALDRAKK